MIVGAAALLLRAPRPRRRRSAPRPALGNRARRRRDPRGRHRRRARASRGGRDVEEPPQERQRRDVRPRRRAAEASTRSSPSCPGFRFAVVRFCTGVRRRASRSSASISNRRPASSPSRRVARPTHGTHAPSAKGDVLRDVPAILAALERGPDDRRRPRPRSGPRRANTSLPVRASVASTAGFGAAGACLARQTAARSRAHGRERCAGESRALQPARRAGGRVDGRRVARRARPARQGTGRTSASPRSRRLAPDDSDAARFAAQTLDWSGADGRSLAGERLRPPRHAVNAFHQGPVADLFARSSDDIDVFAGYQTDFDDRSSVRMRGVPSPIDRLDELGHGRARPARDARGRRRRRPFARLSPSRRAGRATCRSVRAASRPKSRSTDRDARRAGASSSPRRAASSGVSTKTTLCRDRSGTDEADLTRSRAIGLGRRHPVRGPPEKPSSSRRAGARSRASTAFFSIRTSSHGSTRSTSSRTTSRRTSRRRRPGGLARGSRRAVSIARVGRLAGERDGEIQSDDATWGIVRSRTPHPRHGHVDRHRLPLRVAVAPPRRPAVPHNDIEAVDLTLWQSLPVPSRSRSIGSDLRALVLPRARQAA